MADANMDPNQPAAWANGLRMAALAVMAGAVAACGGGGGSSGVAATPAPPPPAPVPAPPPSAPAPVPAPAPAPGSASLALHVVTPSATDPAIDNSFGSHYAYVNTDTSAANGKLFVFFPASDSKPSQYQLIESAAAVNGYNSIGLAYPNNFVVALKCQPPVTDVNCQGNIRAEAMTGQDLSPQVSISVSDSVVNRLAKALTYLNATYPAEGWGTYLVNGVIQWNLIRVSGHSQGGGTAAYAAKQQLVDRVCTFSSPADYIAAQNTPAPWLFAATATPTESYYGFGDTQDTIVPWIQLQQNWAALGMTGPVHGVDNDLTGTLTAVPYGGSHQLFTNALVPAADVSSSSSPHGVPVSDSVTPMDGSGIAMFLPIWRYACFD